jgi:DNA-binding response OmpR family regulator
MAHKVLIADDEPTIVSTLRAYLLEAGLQVVTARNGREAVFAFRHEQPTLVILDVMMPEMDGWEAARLIRKESQVPLLFLTARVDDIDHVTGLEIGADEYLTKPFSPRVLVAHVRALLRRVYGELAITAPVWRVGELEVNSETHTVLLGSRRIDLTPTEFELLATLIARPGRVFTRMELLDRLEGQSFAAFERAIDVHVKNLRHKIEDDPKEPQYIETVFGIGYRMREAT